MLKGAPMTWENKYTYAIFKDIDIIYNEWDRETFSLTMRGALQKIIEKH